MTRANGHFEVMDMNDENKNKSGSEEEAALSCAEEILEEYLDAFLELAK